MSRCKPILGLKLDDESKKAIAHIKKKTNLGKALGVAISVGVISNIFTKSNFPVAALNITQTEWGLFAEAMKSIPAITNRAIQKDVEDMIIYYNLNYNSKHLRFWEGLYNGCTQ